MIPPVVRSLAYIWAVTRRNKIGAITLPESIIDSLMPSQRTPLIRARISPPKAPIAAASDGVVNPPQIVPSTTKIRAITPLPLIIS